MEVRLGGQRWDGSWMKEQSEPLEGSPPQNMLLWHIDYFELKATEKEYTAGALSPLPFCLKAGHKFPLLNKGALPLPNQEEKNEILIMKRRLQPA